MNLSRDEKLSLLNHLAEQIDPQPDHWIGNYPGGDNAMSYCRSCCEKNIGLLMQGQHVPEPGENDAHPLNDTEKQEVLEDKPFVDGGSASSYDNIPTCKTCHAALTGFLTDTAIDDEFYHHLSQGKENIVKSAYAAWELVTLFDAVNDTDARINQVLDSLTIENENPGQS